jgi:hypothetical protein
MFEKIGSLSNSLAIVHDEVKQTDTPQSFACQNGQSSISYKKVVGAIFIS